MDQLTNEIIAKLDQILDDVINEVPHVKHAMNFSGEDPTLKFKYYNTLITITSKTYDSGRKKFSIILDELANLFHETYVFSDLDGIDSLTSKFDNVNDVVDQRYIERKKVDFLETLNKLS